MTLHYRSLTVADIPDVLQLWGRTPGMELSAADHPEALAAFLTRNQGLSWLVEQGAELAGAVLVGHDGRRGWMHHLAVASAYRRQGLARDLVDRALASLADQGIGKCHVMVFQSNALGQSFWAGIGAVARPELSLFSALTPLGAPR